MEDLLIPFYESSNKILIKSKNCYQFDFEGKKYIDFESGVWCANLGHCNSRINKVIAAKVKDSLHQGYKFINHYSENLSRELLRISGIMDGGSVFLSSGSEAINLAITLARKITNRKKILKISNSYLSAFGFGQISADNKFLLNVKFNDINSISKIDYSDVAALILETGGASLEVVKFPSSDFINKLAKTIKEKGCLLVADEITTGMGRLGKWFGFQYYNVHPDIVVTGKALGNGYPISSVSITADILSKFKKDPFKYAQSHQNDPLGCAVGLEVIKIIEEKRLIERSNMIGEYFKNNLEKLKISGIIKDLRARGLMLAIEFNNKVNSEIISRKLFESGFIVGNKINSLRFMPPLTIKKKDIDQLVRKISEIIGK